MHHLQHRIMATVHAAAARWRGATADDRGELNSNVAWAGLMLVIAVSVAGIVKVAVEGAAGRFNFGF
ncbi:MAG TPA: hypothetical protein VFZ77_10980 [Acidimicrobiales bacterium]